MRPDVQAPEPLLTRQQVAGHRLIHTYSCLRIIESLLPLPFQPGQAGFYAPSPGGSEPSRSTRPARGPAVALWQWSRLTVLRARLLGLGPKIPPKLSANAILRISLSILWPQGPAWSSCRGNDPPGPPDLPSVRHGLLVLGIFVQELKLPTSFLINHNQGCGRTMEPGNFED
jgi:hypothetical protein